MTRFIFREICVIVFPVKVDFFFLLVWLNGNVVERLQAPETGSLLLCKVVGIDRNCVLRCHNKQEKQPS